jgi:rod shape determining protein RodA
MRQPSTSSWRHFDFWLLGAVALLVIFGIAMINSAVAGNIELEQLNLVQRQIIFALIGFAIVLGAAAIDYHLWASLSRTLYIGTFALLMILFIVGAAFYGSARWFDTGIILIQPSEIAKIVLILVLADFFSKNIERIGDLRTIARSLILAMGITVWILLQPNLSTSIVMMVIWFAMLFASGLSWKHLAAFAAAAIALPVAAFPFLVDYQQRRILNFLFPDPNASYGETYNLQQALIAIGSGGWFGMGYGHGSQVQLRFLKVRWSDFIFSSMAQEFGFVGVILVLAVFIFVIVRILRSARLARDTYGALICYGVAAMLVFQAIVNAGVNLNLMPATGLTFPFISYGGSSLLSALLGIGLVESVILRHKSLEF